MARKAKAKQSLPSRAQPGSSVQGWREQAERRGQRPERQAAAETFYSSSEAARYQSSARMAVTQRHLADRAVQLLDLPKGSRGLLLDLGCGTGFSGAVLERAGHFWLGIDIHSWVISGLFELLIFFFGFFSSIAFHL